MLAPGRYKTGPRKTLRPRKAVDMSTARPYRRPASVGKRESLNPGTHQRSGQKCCRALLTRRRKRMRSCQSSTALPLWRGGHRRRFLSVSNTLGFRRDDAKSLWRRNRCSRERSVSKAVRISGAESCSADRSPPEPLAQSERNGLSRQEPCGPRSKRSPEPETRDRSALPCPV